MHEQGNSIDPLAVQLLEAERVCVISVVLGDGSPHSAVVHYSHQLEPLKIFIQTSPTVKVRAVQEKGGTAKAALVAGLSEEKFVTLQMRGVVRIVSDRAELERIYHIHYAKLPEAERYKDASTVFFEFTPAWWRYSDFNVEPEKVIEGALESTRD